MDAETLEQEKPGRTWIWFCLGLFLAAAVGFLLWGHAPRWDGIDERVVKKIEERLASEGYVSTNIMFMHSEAIWFGIPVGWILGTSVNETHLPYRRNGGVLELSYKLKHGQAYDFWVSAEWMHAPRAIAIAEELRKINPAAVVNVLTNDVRALQIDAFDDGKPSLRRDP